MGPWTFKATELLLTQNLVTIQYTEEIKAEAEVGVGVGNLLHSSYFSPLTIAAEARISEQPW